VLIEKVRAMRTEIPRFTTEGLDQGRSRNGQSVPEKFLESASAAVQNSSRLEAAGGADATSLRDAYAYAIAFEPLVEEIFALGRFLANSISVQRTEAGVCALDVYSLAKRISKRKDGVELIPFVEDMQNKLGKKPSRKASSDLVTPAPAPVSKTPAV
jgi:hypothetical protein